MTGLLVSVRSAEEAQVALEAGVDLIDVKEPRRGALGRADDRIIAEVLEVVGGRRPVSAALGDLPSPGDRAQNVPWAGLRLAKYGLAGWLGRDDWQGRWREALGRLPAHVEHVAVAYADWREADAPSPAAVLEAASTEGCRWLLVDTFQKAGQSLLDHWPARELAAFVARVRDHEMKIVLAGSLSARTILEVLAVEPDYVGVRGAACGTDRNGTLDPDSIAALLRLLEPTRAAAQSPP